MTEAAPPGGIDYEDHLIRALADLLHRDLSEVAGASDVTLDLLATAGRTAAERWNIKHRALHPEAQRGGAVVWAMREQRGMTWRQIYDATGIVQRTGARWMKTFKAEGIDPRPDAELDRRWQHGDNPEGGQ
jgi:hypothetical protein